MVTAAPHSDAACDFRSVRPDSAELVHDLDAQQRQTRG
jgi:hypothetical protein